jgi:hypothetical protein
VQTLRLDKTELGQVPTQSIHQHVWMAPDLQEFFSRDEQWSLAVMCPAFSAVFT